MALCTIIYKLTLFSYLILFLRQGYRSKSDPSFFITYRRFDVKYMESRWAIYIHVSPLSISALSLCVRLLSSVYMLCSALRLQTDRNTPSLFFFVVCAIGLDQSGGGVSPVRWSYRNAHTTLQQTYYTAERILFTKCPENKVNMAFFSSKIGTY